MEKQMSAMINRYIKACDSNLTCAQLDQLSVLLNERNKVMRHFGNFMDIHEHAINEASAYKVFNINEKDQ